MDFEWDEAKNNENIVKHGISFEDARSVFADPMAITRYDIRSMEARWQIMGHLGPTIVILVAYTIRNIDSGETVRIISARRATATERRLYEEGNWV
jgi:uncharacterized DUF497 family protein